ncbi:kinase-like domain-containing protein [Bisporella sp. PMI_857]|nr:kinase-like domain-containing protein [Bisporella sp. PMI_857]
MFASRSYRSNVTSQDSGIGMGQGESTARRFGRGKPELDHLELQFLRVVGRNKVLIATLDDTPLDFVGKSDTTHLYGATMEVHKRNWKGKGVVVKYIRRSYTGEDYSRAMVDLNFELQMMSKQSLHSHRNIPKLLAICFDRQAQDVDGHSVATIHPGLVIELAHEQYPDLRHYFDVGHNSSLPPRLPFQISAHLVADIADGITALHDHDIVHADLKPENILLFPDPGSPNLLVAKVADFGFVGMTTYTNSGESAAMPESRPRGGTAEWSAPECLENPDPFISSGSLQHPSYESCSDIYSFGLLSCYIALGGQTPIQYAPNLSVAKMSDGILDIVLARLEDYYCHDISNGESSFKESAVYIAQQTLHLDWYQRIKSLRSIRGEIFGVKSRTTREERGTKGKFVLNFNLFPQTAYEFKRDGLYDAYLASPPEFREKVFESFRKISSGPFGQFVAAEVWACMKEQQS